MDFWFYAGLWTYFAIVMVAVVAIPAGLIAIEYLSLKDRARIS